MKILKTVDISNWSYKHKCSACESELEVEENDLKYYYDAGDYRESSVEYVSAICPICNTSFRIPSNCVSKILLLKVKNRTKTNSYDIYDR